jgi:uncharacterized protein
LGLQRSNTNIVRFLLQQKAVPNVLDASGNTPMHWAAEYDNEPVIRLLMEFGGSLSLNTKNDGGLTPLQAAKQNRSKKAVRTLRKLRSKRL